MYVCIYDRLIFDYRSTADTAYEILSFVIWLFCIK